MKDGFDSVTRLQSDPLGLDCFRSPYSLALAKRRAILLKVQSTLRACRPDLHPLDHGRGGRNLDGTCVSLCHHVGGSIEFSCYCITVVQLLLALQNLILFNT